MSIGFLSVSSIYLMSVAGAFGLGNLFCYVFGPNNGPALANNGPVVV